jgi:hypothetical protein
MSSSETTATSTAGSPCQRDWRHGGIVGRMLGMFVKFLQFVCTHVSARWEEFWNVSG